jgi:tetratricopeptide (TPR) repeat protein
MRLTQTFAKLLLLVPVLMLAASDADAQRRGKAEAEKEPMFPAATREEPSARPHARLQRDLQKLFEISQEEGKEAESEELAQKILTHRSAGAYDKAITHRLMAFMEINRDDYPAAIEQLKKAVAENGLSNDDHFQSMFQIGQLQFQEDQFDASIDSLRAFIAGVVEPKQDQVALLGNALYRAERYEEAVVELRKAVSMSGEPDPAVSQLLMASLFELKRTEEAAEVAARLLEQDRDNASLIRNLSAIYVNADLIPQAIEVLADGLARGITAEERDYKQLSQLYRYSENDAKAIELLNDGLAKGVLQPSLEIYRGLGEANYFSENIAAAAEAFGKADELASDGEMALNYARTLAELERWSEAKAAANRAISKGVKRPGDAYVILGAAEFGLNNQAGAMAAYREAAKYPETKAMAEAYLRQASRR